MERYYENVVNSLRRQGACIDLTPEEREFVEIGYQHALNCAHVATAIRASRVMHRLQAEFKSGRPDA